MITPRLECILNHVSGRVVADIGCDHAYIPIRLIADGRAERVIASDLNEGPLNIARSNIAKNGFSDKIETRLGGGLSVLSPGEADMIIIAGMGGEMIEKMLRADEGTARKSKLLLQPMNSQYELRKFLILNGYNITAEDMALEGFKVYNIIEAESGHRPPFENEFDYQIPPYLYGHRYFKNLYDKKKREFERIVHGLEGAAKHDGDKYELYKYFLKELNEIEGKRNCRID